MYRKAESVRPDLTPDKLYALYKHEHDQDTRITPQIHAGRLGMPYGIYMGRFWLGEQGAAAGKIQAWELGSPLELEGDYLCIGDVHCPFQSTEWIGLACAIGKKHLKRPRKLIIGGDFFDFDIFSTFAALVRSPGWHEEKTAARAVMADFSRVFDEVVMLTGNHERRLTRSTDGELNAQDIADLLSVNIQKVRMSDFAYCHLKSGGADWHISHVKNYGINQLIVLNELANKWQQNILGFHQHHLSLGWDRYKRYLLVEGGTLVRQKGMAYKELEDGKGPEFANGFALIRGGYVDLFGEHTNFERWL